jgi:hypothetical protein
MHRRRRGHWFPAERSIGKNWKDVWLRFSSAGDEVFEAGQQSTGALGVVHIGRRHIDHERQAERVDEQMF